jgi:hypothetical protein
VAADWAPAACGKRQSEIEASAMATIPDRRVRDLLFVLKFIVISL